MSSKAGAKGLVSIPLGEPEVRSALEESLKQITIAVEERLQATRDEYDTVLSRRKAEWDQEVESLSMRIRVAEEAAERLSGVLAELQLALEKAQRENESLRVEHASRKPAEPTPVKPRAATGEKAAGSTKPGIGMAAWLKGKGFQVIDKRPSGGALWVIGPPEQFQPVLLRLKEKGISFTHAPNGSRATGGRPGWFTKSKK